MKICTHFTIAMLFFLVPQTSYCLATMGKLFSNNTASTSSTQPSGTKYYGSTRRQPRTRSHSRRPPTQSNSGGRSRQCRRGGCPNSGSETRNTVGDVKDVSSNKSGYYDMIKEQVYKLGGRLLSKTPRDISNFCPGYSSMSKDRKAGFWATLIYSMMKYESNYKTNTTHREKFTDRGRPIISTGLLQISRNSARGYGCKFISSNYAQGQRDLKTPYKNIACGVIIMNRLVGNHGVVASGKKGGAGYWAVLRTTLAYSRKARRGIIGKTKAFCRGRSRGQPRTNRRRGSSQ